MQETIQRIFGQLLDKWKALERKNKILIIITTAVIISAIAITVLIFTQPHMEPVTTASLSYKTAVEVSNALNEAGIDNNISDDFSTVYVRREQLIEAKRVMITEGVPSEGLQFGDVMDTISMGTTSDTMDMIKKEYTESKLKRELEAWPNINSVTVALSLEADNALHRPLSKRAKASININVTPDFTKANAKAVASYVKASILGLELENIVVISNGTELFNGETEQNSTSAADLELEQQKRSQIKTELVRHYKIYDDVEVSMNLEINRDYYKEETEEYSAPLEDSDRGLISSQTKREQSVQNGEMGDEPGTVTNGGDIPEYDYNGELASTAESTESDTNYELNRKVTQTEKLPGTIDVENSTLALTFYKSKTYFEDSAEKAGLLADKTWEEYKEEIRSQIVPLTIDDAMRQEMINTAANASGIRNVTVSAYELPVFRDKDVVSVPIGSYAAVAVLIALIALLALGLIRRTEPEEITEFEPELSVEELLVSTQQEPESADSVAGIDYAAESELKKQLDKFVDDNPEAVAQLLRNWLSDEWE